MDVDTPGTWDQRSALNLVLDINVAINIGAYFIQ
jgi:hypothetical protein